MPIVLGPPDAGEVLTLQRAAFVSEARSHHDLDLPPLRQSLAQLRAELADPRTLTLGIRDVKGRLVASVRARTDGAEASVARLMVAPDRQGEGLGSRLLASIEDQLPATVTRLRMITGEHSVANLRLYARFGYAETRRTPIAAGYRLVHLAKARTCGHPE